MTARITREVTRDGGTIRYVHSFCSECGYWYAFTWTIEKAYTAGELHLINVHDIDPKNAYSARNKAEQRTRDRADTPSLSR